MAEPRDVQPSSETRGLAAAVEDPRVRFAAERTLLAWLRTGVTLMGFGFVVARFGLLMRELAVAHHEPPPGQGWSAWIGTGLVMLGVLITLLAAAEHGAVLKRLNRGEGYVAPRWSLALLVSAAIVVIGIARVAYLILFSP